MGEQAGGAERLTSALFSASNAEGDPDASEDSNEDTDTDSDVLFGPDLASESDPWCDSPSVTRQSPPMNPMLDVRSIEVMTPAAHAGLVSMLVGLRCNACMWVCRDIEESEDIRPELDHGSFLTSMVPESRRHLQRYVGHANVQTDIKEVTYLGNNDELVAAGEGTPAMNLFHHPNSGRDTSLHCTYDTVSCGKLTHVCVQASVDDHVACRQ